MIKETDIMATIERVVEKLKVMNPTHIEKFYSIIIWCVHNIAIPKGNEKDPIVLRKQHQELLLKVIG